MPENKPIELRYYPRADPDALVFHRIWGLVQQGTSTPVEYDVAAAYLDIIVDGRAKGKFQLGSGLTYDPVSKAVRVQIANGAVAFLKDEAETEYKFYVEWEHGAVQTLREGTVTAVRVA